MYFRIWFFILRNKWTGTGFTFFNEKKGVTIATGSYNNVEVKIRTNGQSNVIEYSRFWGSAIIWYLRRNNERERRRQEHHVRKEVHDNFKSTFRKDWYPVNINDHQEKLHGGLVDWLKAKGYEYNQKDSLYYFSNKDHAVEFRLIWA